MHRPPRMPRRHKTSVCEPNEDVQPSLPLACALDFHAAFDLPAHSLPQRSLDPDLVELRIRLLTEEVCEFVEAARAGDLIAVADALADITYVVYGTAVTYGIDLDAAIREVHRSNMSKLGPDGAPLKRADGKVLKPASYRAPDLGAVLDCQIPLPVCRR